MFYIFYSFCVSACLDVSRVPQPVLGAQSNLGELYLSFHCVGPGHEAQVVRHAIDRSYP